MTNQSPTKALILGTGPVGLSIMDDLLARGACVTLVNRSGRINEPLPADVELVQADVTNAETVAQLSAEVDVVFHCVQPGYADWPSGFPPLNHAILAGVSQTNAKLVVTDNLYMYGPTQGKSLHEDLPYAATGAKGKARADMARLFLDAHNNGKLKVVLGRASDFYGPRVLNSAVGAPFFQPALAGKPVNVLGNPDLPHTYTYIRDFARGLVTLSEHDDAFGRAWHVASADTITTRQLADLVADAIGQPVTLRGSGRLMLMLVGLFQPAVREFKEMLYEFEEPFVMDDSAFRGHFDSPTTPHAQAVAETVAWFQQQS